MGTDITWQQLKDGGIWGQYQGNSLFCIPLLTNKIGANKYHLRMSVCHQRTFDVIRCCLVSSDVEIWHKMAFHDSSLPVICIYINTMKADLFISIINTTTNSDFLLLSDFIWYYLISFNIIWCLLMSSDVIWCLLMSSDVCWCHLMISDVMWCH